VASRHGAGAVVLGACRTRLPDFTDMDIANRLRASKIPAGAGHNVRPALDRELVWATIRAKGQTSGRRVAGVAISWADDAVHVQIVDGTSNYLLWLAAGDVERRIDPSSTDEDPAVPDA